MFCFEMRMKDSKSLNWRPIFLFEAFSKFSKHAVQWFNDIQSPLSPLSLCQELQQMMGSCGMRPSEVKTLVDVLDTDDDGDMVSWFLLVFRFALILELEYSLSILELV